MSLFLRTQRMLVSWISRLHMLFGSFFTKGFNNGVVEPPEMPGISDRFLNHPPQFCVYGEG